jgi:hypothetical protein
VKHCLRDLVHIKRAILQLIEKENKQNKNGCISADWVVFNGNGLSNESRIYLLQMFNRLLRLEKYFHLLIVYCSKLSRHKEIDAENGNDGSTKSPS